MKKIFFSLSMLFMISVSVAQENLAVNSFRNIPASEMNTFMQNEAFYWSKVAAILKEKGQITAWAIHVKVAGRMSTEPNVQARVGVGSWENYENLGANYAAAETLVKSQMDPEKRVLLEESLKQEKFEIGVFLTNTIDLIWNDDAPKFNYTVLNYSNAANPAVYLQEESRIMKPFFQKLMRQGKTKLSGWGSAQVLAPVGYDYPFNVFTVDFYEKISDVFNPFGSNTVSWPDEMASLGELKTPGFWKRAVWKRVMYLNNDNKLVSDW